MNILGSKSELASLKEGKLLINTINAHSYNTARKDALFAEALSCGDVLIPDGVSVVKACKWIHAKSQPKERIAGWDLFTFEMNKLEKESAKDMEQDNGAGKKTVMFMGSSQKVLDLIVKKVAEVYPHLNVKTYSPPYKPEFSDEDNHAIIEAIHAANPDLLWIGMTAPKQEKWTYSHWNQLNIHCHVGTIGAVFDFFAGTVERAPEWWQQHGLEWLYRLMKEPKRMWRRYIIGNTLFLWNMLKESCGKKVLLLLMLLTFATNMSAKSLNELWVSMPDSLMPMVNKSQRIEFLDLKNLGVKAEVDNLLGESCQLDSVTSDYLKLTTSPSSLYEMRLLPQTSGDSLLCIVRTFSAPEKESELKFYDQEWKELEGTSLLPSNLSDVSLYMQAKPDTMNLERYHELQAMIEPQMFHLTWSEDGNELVSQLSLPLLGKEEKAQMLALLMQRKFKWDGEKFKEI